MKKGDRLLVVALTAALVAFGCWWLLSRVTAAGSSAEGGPVVVCQTKDGYYRADPLSSDATYTVKTKAGDWNVVQIKDGEVDVTKANCANQVCVDHDPIRQEGEQIVCLPHGMVVEVVANEADATSLS